MLPNSSPPRNRLLALEQELQARRSTGDRPSQSQQHRPVRTAHTLVEAASINPTPTPSVRPPVQNTRQRHSTAAAAPDKPSPWQLLAARLNRSQSSESVSPFLEPDLAPPDFASEPAESSRNHSLPEQTRHTKSTIATSPQAVFGKLARERVTPPPTASDPPKQARVNSDRDHDSSDNEFPPTSWQDLANQIHQARLPLRPHNQTPAPQTTHSQTFSSPPIQTEIVQVQREQPEIIQPETEQVEADDSIQANLDQFPGQSEFGLLAIAHATLAQPVSEPIEDLVFIEDTIEEWKQDGTDITTLDVVATKVDSSKVDRTEIDSSTVLDHATPSANSGAAPFRADSKTAIVLFTPHETGNAHPPQPQPGEEILATYPSTRAGPFNP